MTTRLPPNTHKTHDTLPPSSSHLSPLSLFTHPFICVCQVRMTTRFKSDDVLEGLTGAIHETGHALYEQGRNLVSSWGMYVRGASSLPHLA